MHIHHLAAATSSDNDVLDTPGGVFLQTLARGGGAGGGEFVSSEIWSCDSSLLGVILLASSIARELAGETISLSADSCGASACEKDDIEAK